MLLDAMDLMIMTDQELKEYSEELDWIRSLGITEEMDQDIEQVEIMIEMEIANR